MLRPGPRRIESVVCAILARPWRKPWGRGATRFPCAGLLWGDEIAGALRRSRCGYSHRLEDALLLWQRPSHQIVVLPRLDLVPKPAHCGSHGESYSQKRYLRAR
jgi:hypothetical protein